MATVGTQTSTKLLGVGISRDKELICTTAGVVHLILAAEEMEAEAAVDVCCYTYGKTPSEWLEYGVIALASFHDKLTFLLH